MRRIYVLYFMCLNVKNKIWLHIILEVIKSLFLTFNIYWLIFYPSYFLFKLYNVGISWVCLNKNNLSVKYVIIDLPNKSNHVIDMVILNKGCMKVV